jgi:ASC-1-like (ASCH) protein
MNYNLNLNDRPFIAIKDGSKKIEGRTPKDERDNRYTEMKVGDTITFTNNVTNEVMKVEILRTQHYPDVRLMLETEGTRNVLSSGLDIEGGIKSYNSLDGYEERIKKYGIYGIEVRCI